MNLNTSNMYIIYVVEVIGLDGIHFWVNKGNIFICIPLKEGGGVINVIGLNFREHYFYTFSPLKWGVFDFSHKNSGVMIFPQEIRSILIFSEARKRCHTEKNMTIHFKGEADKSERFLRDPYLDIFIF